MSKFIYAKSTTISIENYKRGHVFVQMDLPMSFSLLDLVEIIKMYSDYNNTYDWTFDNERKKNKSLSLRNDFKKLEKIRLHEFQDLNPGIECFYGPIEMRISTRSSIKYRKVYPTIYQAHGRFPTEKEFLENIKIPNMDGLYTIPGKSKPSAEHMINEDLIKYGERLKSHFMNKYKISSEIVDSFYGAENLLIKKQ